MEQLLVHGRVPVDGPPLMEVTSLRLEDVIKDRGLILLDEQGKRISKESLCTSSEYIGIGAYPHGEFSPEVRKMSKANFSISGHVLETQHVLCRLISACAQD